MGSRSGNFSDVATWYKRRDFGSISHLKKVSYLQTEEKDSRKMTGGAVITVAFTAAIVLVLGPSPAMPAPATGRGSEERMQAVAFSAFTGLRVATLYVSIMSN